MKRRSLFVLLALLSAAAPSWAEPAWRLVMEDNFGDPNSSTAVEANLPDWTPAVPWQSGLRQQWGRLCGWYQLMCVDVSIRSTAAYRTARLTVDVALRSQINDISIPYVAEFVISAVKAGSFRRLVRFGRIDLSEPSRSEVWADVHGEGHRVCNARAATGGYDLPPVTVELTATATGSSLRVNDKAVCDSIPIRLDGEQLLLEVNTGRVGTLDRLKLETQDPAVP